MRSMWAKIDKLDNGISRDFIRLTQVIHTIGQGDTVKYQLAVILENCLKDEDYKNTAIQNLVGLTRDYKQLGEDLQQFACSNDPAYRDIKPIAKEILEKLMKKLKLNL